jgi:hypothetical protein
MGLCRHPDADFGVGHCRVELQPGTLTADAVGH